jgi:hypothetical protein
MDEIKLVKYKNQVYPYRDVHYIKNWKPSWEGRMMLLRNSSRSKCIIIKLIDNDRYVTKYNLKRFMYDAPAYAFHSTDRLFEVSKEEALAYAL